jgi:hypothetical protein
VGWKRSVEIAGVVALFVGGCRGVTDPCGDAGSVGTYLKGAPCQALNARAKELCTQDASACIPSRDERVCENHGECCEGLCCSQDTNHCEPPPDGGPDCWMGGRLGMEGVDYLPFPWGFVEACTMAFGCDTGAHICSVEMNPCLDRIADAGTCRDLSHLDCSLTCRYPPPD